MKLKIKVKYRNADTKRLSINPLGDWIDLYSDDDVYTTKDSTGMINLGVAMKLPSGFEAVVLPRSSTFKTFKITQTNSQGVIDQPYCGNDDWWKYPYIAWENTTIERGDKICQFRIQLSQKANIWQKLKWLFSSGIELVEVEKLSKKNRGGFGTTGKK